MSLTKPDESLQFPGSDAGNGLVAKTAGWSFGGGVAAQFDQHVSSSIPDYREGHVLVLSLSDFFVRPGGLIYEFGASTGALSSQLDARHRERGCRVVGLDIEESMVLEARKQHQSPRLEFVEADVVSYNLAPSNYIVAYYTLQFLSVEDRQEVARKAFNSLSLGGAFIVFEKTRHQSSQVQDILAQLYSDFKLENGFDPSQVLAKTRSLRSVLEPLPSAENLELLRKAGFGTVAQVHKNLLFEGYLAIKSV